VEAGNLIVVVLVQLRRPFLTQYGG
jgi:hypothetical protein